MPSLVRKGLAISDFDPSLKFPKVLQYSDAYNILPICSLSTGSEKEHCMIIRKKYISNTKNPRENIKPGYWYHTTSKGESTSHSF